MKMILAAATALTLSGSALAYQTTNMDNQTDLSTQTDVQADVGMQPADPMNADMTMSTTATAPGMTVTMDPTVAITAPTSWTAEQRALYDEHLAFLPSTWSAEQRAMFEQQLAIPPAQWTPEQRALYEAHMAYLPTTWTAEQRAMYEQQTAQLRTPWMATNQTAWAAPVNQGTTYAMASTADRVSEPGNEDPEHDARGIAVISDAALVPAGYNGVTATAMGGPLLDTNGQPIDAADNSYPACTATVTDNCIQLYERGVRSALADESQTTGVGGPYEPVSTSSSLSTGGGSTIGSTGTTSTTNSTSSMDLSTTPPSGSVSSTTNSSTSTDTTGTTQSDMTGTTEDDTLQPDQ